MKNILYITYDGICEPLGISQSLSYLEKLSPEFNIHIISYEKKKEINNSKNFKLIKKRLAKAGITCSFLKYHINSNYFAKIYDIFIGILIIFFFDLNILATCGSYAYMPRIRFLRSPS